MDWRLILCNIYELKVWIICVNFLLNISIQNLIQNHLKKTGVAPNLKNDSIIDKIRGIFFAIWLLQYGFLAVGMFCNWSHVISFLIFKFQSAHFFFKSQLCFTQGVLIKARSYIDFEGRGCSWPFLEDENVHS